MIKQKYILRCFELALKGMGNTSPNPLVGCVIVYNDNIIGEGYHQQYGKAHAEVNAINAVVDKSLLKDSTLYVNLEPCVHHGKTPPCVDLILKYNIPNIVIANSDPFEKVNGGGIDKLKALGCKVYVEICKDEGRFLNRRFFTFHEKKRPYIILKWAQTLDGFIDVDRSNKNSRYKYWITNDKCRMLVHKWRSEESAIMIGANTALNDNPQLNVREWVGKNPVRIVIDENNCLNTNLNIFDGSVETLIFSPKKLKIPNTEFIEIDFAKPIIPQIINVLFERNIISVIIEGGKMLLTSFIENNIWDEARVLVGNKEFTKGVKAPSLLLDYDETLKLDEDNIYFYYNHL